MEGSIDTNLLFNYCQSLRDDFLMVLNYALDDQFLLKEGEPLVKNKLFVETQLGFIDESLDQCENVINHIRLNYHFHDHKQRYDIGVAFLDYLSEQENIIGQIELIRKCPADFYQKDRDERSLPDPATHCENNLIDDSFVFRTDSANPAFTTDVGEAFYHLGRCRNSLLLNVKKYLIGIEEEVDSTLPPLTRSITKYRPNSRVAILSELGILDHLRGKYKDRSYDELVGLLYSLGFFNNDEGRKSTITSYVKSIYSKEGINMTDTMRTNVSNFLNANNLV